MLASTSWWVTRGEEDELPTVYVGEGDVIRNRIDSPFQNKDFWSRAIVFTASNNSLNKAHVKWLEYVLVNRAAETKQCILDNGTEPQEPGLSEAERSDTQGFLREILQILPLVGLRAFEVPKPVVQPRREAAIPKPASSTEFNTVIVPAQQDGFGKVFLGENCWYAIWHLWWDAAKDQIHSGLSNPTRIEGNAFRARRKYRTLW